jgi:hypothetical protein
MKRVCKRPLLTKFQSESCWFVTWIPLHTIQCEPSIFEKVFIWFLGQPVVWSEPNISQIEAWSYSNYAWYQEFEFEFEFEFDFF